MSSASTVFGVTAQAHGELALLRLWDGSRLAGGARDCDPCAQKRGHLVTSYYY